MMLQMFPRKEGKINVVGGKHRGRSAENTAFAQHRYGTPYSAGYARQ